MSKLLQLVPYDAPVLRLPTELVLDPRSKMIKEIAADMVYSIQPQFLSEPAAGMAANQWGISQQIFVYCPHGNDKTVQLIFNPTYEPLADSSQDLSWEGCFSIPLALGKIRRHTKIRVTYLDKKGKFHSKILEGWAARVWQHETDHLRGCLYDMIGDQCCEKRLFLSEAEKDKFLDTQKPGTSLDLI